MRQISDKDKKEVYVRDKGCCIVCGTRKGPFHYDHQFPYTSGGLSIKANVGLLCEECNLKKAHYRVSWARLKEIIEKEKRHGKNQKKT
jgi:5-methylcytosine-specific restriction endonuclease McrA